MRNLQAMNERYSSEALENFRKTKGWKKSGL